MRHDPAARLLMSEAFSEGRRVNDVTWRDYHRQLWSDLEVREEPAAGRRLDVGGFVFCDPPEVIFRSIGSDYIRRAWDNLGRVLAQAKIVVDDLRWGAMHPGETEVAKVDSPAPCRYIGWTSQGMAYCDREPRWRSVDETLAQQSPVLRCAFTWRSLQWRMLPAEIPLGLRLFEALAIDEAADWNPDFVFSVPRDKAEAWIRVAAAVRDVDQEALNRALAAAAADYSPLGYRIVARGFEGYAAGWDLGLQFPQLST